jgi:2-iminobutanoate/2-iminopropanoate deaminase
MREKIATQEAPQAIGPYSQAIRAGGLIFASGQVALEPATGELVNGDVRAQTERALQNLGAVLAAAGSSFEKVVKTTVYLITMDDFSVMNETYAKFFPAPHPARSTVAVAALPRQARVEIDVIALP